MRLRPLAASAATTSAAPPRRSAARAHAPCSCRTGRMSSVRPCTCTAAPKAAKPSAQPNLRSNTLQGLYTPGSTFKPAVAVAALDSGLINQYSTVYCNGVYNYFKDYHPRCTRHGHSGNIDVVTAIKWSCNIFFYDVGRRLTSDVYDAYAYKLGLGQRTGVEVSEAVGRLTTKSDSNYTASLDVQAAIGQGNTVVSPIQLATYAATLANNGTRYRTHFVKAILDTNTGEVLSETKPEVMDVIEGTGNTFELVRQIHQRVGKAAHMA